MSVLRVGFAGTPAFAAAALTAIVDAGFAVPLVLTQPDRPSGRGLKVAPSPVKSIAAANGIAVFQPPSLKSGADRAAALAVPIDVLVVAAYGLILPPAVLTWPRHGGINVHASKLPRWRGAAPIQRALLAGDRETGVTIMQMDAGLDTGGVIAVVDVPIATRETTGTLTAKLADAGAAAIVSALNRLARDGALPSVPQPAAGVTYAAKIVRDEAAIDWSQPSMVVDRAIRAFDPAPGATTRLGADAVKVWAADPMDATPGAAPGVVLAVAADGMTVACGAGALRLRTVQPAGGKRMTAAAFAAGRGLAAGARGSVRAIVQHEQRMAALAVRRVLEGATLPAALAAVDDGAATRGRALVQELAYGTLRHWGRMAALADALAAKPLTDAPLRALVAVALYQLDHTQAPAFAVVDRAVEAAALLARPQVKPLVNAMLRRYLRERAALNEAVAAASPVARWSYPRWWIGRVEADHPRHWQAILEAGNARPPLTLRVNRRVTDRDALAARFAEHGIATDAVGEAGLVVRAPRPVTELPGYADGAFSVQDAGAQLAAPLLRLSDGLRVLDACAAPGGKATHVAELATVDLTAVEHDEGRLARVNANFERLGLAGPTVHVVAGDAAQPARWWDGRPFDRILADVPCTASGIVRRHPDGKWLRRKTDIETFGAQQRRLLAGLWPLLAPGGLLLYATCSVFLAENELQINAFLAACPGALRETLSFPADCLYDGGQLLPSGKAAGHNQDGFFYALLRKAQAGLPAGP